MSVQLVERFEDFAALREAWNELAESVAPGEPYSRHEWFEEWITAYGVAGQLAIPVLWRDGQLAAIAPLRRSSTRFRGLRAKTLEFLYSPVAPRCNFLAHSRETLSPLVDAVFERIPNWDLLITENMASDATATTAYLAELERRGQSYQDAEGFRSPYRVLRGDFDSYWASLPRERRRYLKKKCMHRLEREGDYSFGKVSERGELEALLPEIYRISAKSWKAGVGSALQEDSKVARALLGFALRGIEQGWVALHTLRLHGELIAFEYLFTGAGSQSVVRSDYDLDYKYFAPGNSLRLHIVRELFESADEVEYDLGGDDAPYKLEWCDSLREHRSITAANKSLAGRAILFAKLRLLPALRRLTTQGRAS